MKAAEEQREREEQEEKRKAAEKKREEKKLEREVRSILCFIHLTQVCTSYTQDVNIASLRPSREKQKDKDN